MALRLMARNTSALRAVPRRVRTMAHDIDAPEHQQAVDLWQKISMGMVAGVGVVTAVVMFKEMTGEHEHHHPPKYPYLHIRTKPYPWAASDCNLFDFDCKAGKSH